MRRIKIREMQNFVTVELSKGDIIPFSREDIQEMLDNRKLYQVADNLPKWIYEAALHGSDNFKKFKKFDNIWLFLEQLVKSNGAIIVANSELPYRSKIDWI